jgi:hypothetical protein
LSPPTPLWRGHVQVYLSLCPIQRVTVVLARVDTCKNGAMSENVLHDKVTLGIVGWINLAQDRDSWRIVDTVMNV